MNENILFSVSEASKRMGIGKTMLYQEINAGRLDALKCGRRTLIPQKAIENWINRLPVLGKS